MDDVIQSDNVNFWKIYLLENVKMAIISNYIFCIGCNCTIYEFIIIWVSHNQFEAKIWRNKLCMRIINYHAYGSFSKFTTCKSLQLLFVFF